MPTMSNGQDGSDLHPVDPTEVLEVGSRVAVSGAVHVNGRHYARGRELEELFRDLELEYKARVSKTRCDALIVDPAAPVSGQLRSALEFGTPVITHPDFAAWAAGKLAQLRPVEAPPQELAAPETEVAPVQPERPAASVAEAEQPDVVEHSPETGLLPVPGDAAAVTPRPESLELAEASARMGRDLRRGAVALAIVLAVFFLLRQVRGRGRGN